MISGVGGTDTEACRLAKAAIKAAMYGNLDGKVIWENADCLGEDWAMLNSFTF